MQTTNRKTNAADALGGIWTVALASFVIGLLYFGRELLIPIALAILLAFLLSPLVLRIERWIGRIAAVLIVVAIIFGMIIGGGWALTRQLVDLADRLPNYRENIAVKLHAIRLPAGGAFSRLSSTIEDLKKDLPGATPPVPNAPAGANRPAGAATPAPNAAVVPVQVIDAKRANLPELVRMAVAPLVGPLGTTGLVLLLVIFILLKREDLRSRMIRLVGQGFISETTQAMDDAGQRISRYLLMLLIVNICYGILVAIGLYFIGLPNVLVWGAVAAVLRFIPYIGPWIGASIPFAISIAVSTGWTMPLFTFGLFLGLELINANFIEPALYGSTTGVSPIALIMAAVFWTWLWGPVGLVLATPLTVCLVVMGRHIPKLAFLSVMLSDEEPLQPHEEFYHRLLAVSTDEASHLVDAFLREHSLAELYDEVFIPALTVADSDFARQSIDAEQRASLQRDVWDILDELEQRPADDSDTTGADQPIVTVLTCRILCLPARAERDALAGAMLSQLLRQKSFAAENAGAKLVSGELIELVEQSDVDVVCISVVPPSTHIHARYLCAKLRKRFPKLKIVVGLWGSKDATPEATQRLRSSGADEIVTSLASAVFEMAKYAVPFATPVPPLALPAQEEERLTALRRLNILDTASEEAFDRITKKLVRIFDVPMAAVSFVDKDRQCFKSQVGWPTEIASLGSISRVEAICNYVIANNAVLVVEDLAGDPRFAPHPMVQKFKFRFYAGVPLHSPDGRAVGSLCILDTKPRQISDRERKHLLVIAEDVNELLVARVSAPDVDAGLAQIEPAMDRLVRGKETATESQPTDTQA